MFQVNVIIRERLCFVSLEFQQNEPLIKCVISIEYAIAFLGSVEGGLVVTTVNPLYTSEEISRQMLSCRPKAIICHADNVDVMRKACALAQQPDIKLITIQSNQNNSKPNETICFSELINTDGKSICILKR